MYTLWQSKFEDKEVVVATSPSLISKVLPKGSELPTQPMGYGAQVVWCLPPDEPNMRANAEGLHGKRFAAGDAASDKRSSAIVFGLSPDWPQLSDQTDNIRLYICAHGMLIEDKHAKQPPTVKIEPKPSDVCTIQEALSADDFFPYLFRVIQKSPAKKVRRISLVMCFSAGLKGEIPLQDSFAQQLVKKCVGLTVDLTARMDEIDVETTSQDKQMIDRAYLQQKGTNPLFTINVDGHIRSVLNARKLVASAYRSRTYIFTPNQAPRLKPGYTE